jgi:hypothetical protein
MKGVANSTRNSKYKEVSAAPLNRSVIENVNRKPENNRQAKHI